MSSIKLGNCRLRNIIGQCVLIVTLSMVCGIKECNYGIKERHGKVALDPATNYCEYLVMMFELTNLLNLMNKGLNHKVMVVFEDL